MKIFLDTADRVIIERLYRTGLIDGVTTNPTHLSKQQDSPKNVIAFLCSLLPSGVISVEVTEIDPDRLYDQAKAIANIGSNICVKIPCYREYYGIIKQLTLEGIKVNVTLVFTLFQALAMAKFNVEYISIFIGRWDDIGVDALSILDEVNEMLLNNSFSSQLLVASIRHPQHVNRAAMLGVSAITLPPALFETMITHPLTDSGMKKFNEDWKKTGVTQFP